MTHLCMISGEDMSLRLPFFKLLRAQGFKISLVGSEAPEVFEKAGFEYHHFSFSRNIDPIGDWKTVGVLKGIIQRISPDVVHAFDTKPTIYGMIAARQAGVALRLRTINGLGRSFSSNDLKSRALRIPYRFLQKLGDRSCHLTIFQNQDDSETFENLGVSRAEKSRVIRGSGVDPDLVATMARQGIEGAVAETIHKARSENRPIILMASRITPAKGVAEYGDAAQKVSAASGPAKAPLFLLAGPAGSEADGQSALASIADGPVQYIGPRSDLLPLIKASDFFVLPSFYGEGVPRVLIEAAMLSKVIITTDNRGCRDVVDGGRIGWCVEPRSASAVECSINQAIALSPEARNDLEQQVYEYAKDNFSIQKITQQYVSLYKMHIKESLG